MADAAEWQARRAIIEKQSEEARREKQRRRAQAERDGEKARRSQVNLLPSLLAQQHRALSHPEASLRDVLSFNVDLASGLQWRLCQPQSDCVQPELQQCPRGLPTCLHGCSHLTWSGAWELTYSAEQWF